MSETIWCDAAFAPPEIPARLLDARRASGEDAQSVVCVVIDVLRATTTIAASLANGCAAIHPCPSPGMALALTKKRRLQHGSEKIFLGGEQDGKPIAGFDGGNSPLEYTKQKIGGKTLVLSTSNGTKALSAVKGCEEIFTAAFVNITAVAGRMTSLLHRDRRRSLLVACAGREGGYCEEDAVGAGLLLRILSENLKDLEFSDTARAALHVARGAEENLEKTLFHSGWGKHLLALGLGDDVSFCAQKDVLGVVPKMDAGVIKCS